MSLLLAQFRTTIQVLLASLLDGDGLSFNPIFRPMLRTTNPRPGLSMQRIPYAQPTTQPVLPMNEAVYAGRINR